MRDVEQELDDESRCSILWQHSDATSPDFETMPVDGDGEICWSKGAAPGGKVLENIFGGPADDDSSSGSEDSESSSSDGALPCSPPRWPLRSPRSLPRSPLPRSLLTTALIAAVAAAL